ncbi:proteasome regulatory particle base subunit [Sparganum proliferum]
MILFKLLALTLFSELALTVLGQPPALPIGHLTAADKEHVKRVLTESLVDAKSAHFAALGYQSLGEKFDAVAKVCPLFQASANSEDIEVLYHAVSGASILGAATCKVQVPNFGQFMRKKLTSSLTSDQLLHLLFTAKILNEKVDSSTIYDLAQQLRKKDSSASNLANILLIITSLKLEKPVLETFLPDVKALLEQADEADGIYLYYDKGVYTTSLAIDGIFQLAAALGKSPIMSEQQAIKFANFLYSKRRTRQPRSAAYLLVAMRTLSSNAFMVPIVVTGASEHERAAVSGLTISSKRQVSIRLANVLGETNLIDPKKIELTAAGLYRLPSSASLDPTLLGPSSRGAFKPSTDGLFTLDLLTKDGAIPYGRYALEITAKPKQATSPLLVGVTRSRIPVRVPYTVRVNNPQLSIATGDSSRVKVDIPIALDKKLSPPTEVAGPAGSVRVQRNDQLHLAFSLSDSVSGEPVHPHQVFIRLTHDKTRQSITYICEKTSSMGAYSFKLIPDNVASDFDNLFGIYSMDLIIGDALLTNSLIWRIADLDVHLPIDHSSLRGPGEPDIAQQSVASVSNRKRPELSPLIGKGPRKAKPELAHTFRQPEPRPSNLLALTFTGLCIAPFACLLISWIVLGANVWNFPCSISALVFHTGLTGVFALYLWYWIELNMFTTLRYLFFIGLITFFAGNSLLRHISSVRKSGTASPTRPSS